MGNFFRSDTTHITPFWGGVKYKKWFFLKFSLLKTSYINKKIKKNISRI